MTTDDGKRFKKLDNSDHAEVQKFHCGQQEWEREVSDFLRDDALEQQNKGLNVTWLCYSKAQLVGFVSLVASSIGVKHKSRWKNILGLGGVQFPSVPTILVGQLGVQEELQGEGIGEFIFSWVQGLVIGKIGLDVGVKLITLHVDKGNTRGRAFWERQGFMEFDEANMSTHDYMILDLYAPS